MTMGNCTAEMKEATKHLPNLMPIVVQRCVAQEARWIPIAHRITDIVSQRQRRGNAGRVSEASIRRSTYQPVSIRPVDGVHTFNGGDPIAFDVVGAVGREASKAALQQSAAGARSSCREGSAMDYPPIRSVSSSQPIYVG